MTWYFFSKYWFKNPNCWTLFSIIALSEISRCLSSMIGSDILWLTSNNWYFFAVCSCTLEAVSAVMIMFSPLTWRWQISELVCCVLNSTSQWAGNVEPQVVASEQSCQLWQIQHHWLGYNHHYLLCSFCYVWCRVFFYSYSHSVNEIFN